MKNLLLLTVLLLGFTCFSQENNYNFTNTDGDVTWQKVFDNEMESNEIQKYFQNSGIFEEITTAENSFSGELRLFEQDYIGAGYGGLTAYYVREYFYTAFVKIELKDSRYRVSVKKITLSKKSDDSLGSQGSIELLNSIVINNKGQFKKVFFKNLAPIYDFTFLKIFEVKEIEDIENDDEW